MLQRLSDKKNKLFLIQSPEQTNTRVDISLNYMHAICRCFYMKKSRHKI